MKKYLIIGNGVAGTMAAENIRKNDSDGKITIITDEDLPFYFRIRLNEYLAGEDSEEKIIARKEDWYREQDIELVLNSRIVAADPEAKEVRTEDNRAYNYDTLLVATGSHSFVPPIKGSDKPGVFTLRDIRDARRIVSAAAKVDRLVLIGGGLLGLEAGNALRKLGKKIMVVEFFPRLLPRQLDADGAGRLQKIMEGMGFSFRLGARTREIAGRNGIEKVLLESGEELAAEMVIVSAGVRPNLELAGPLGLETDKGIKVDDHLRTSRQDIYGAGDVIEFRGNLYGIWPAAMEQGRIAGANMAGGDVAYGGTTLASTLKVVGIDLASAGDIDAENQFESRVREDKQTYKKIVLQDNRIIGCIMLGETKGFNQIIRAMSEKRDVSELKDKILEEGL